MKIAMIGHKRIPGREGGVEVVVEELASRLTKKGHEVTAYNRKKRGLVMPRSYNGVRLITIPTVEKKNTDAVIYSFFASIRAALSNYDIIHFHAVGPSFFVFIPHFLKKRTIVTVHGLNYLTPKWKGFGAWFIKKGEQHAVKYADKVIVISPGQQAYFKNTYNLDTVYIPNGTQIFDIIAPNLIKTNFGLEKDSYILFLSRVVPGKGLEYLLEAFREIDSDLELIIAGDSPFLSDFNKRISEMALCDKRVKMIGFVDGKIIQELYSNARLFVFPSEAEGMPMCLLEALSYNCPCLVSDIPENLNVGSNYVDTFKTKDVQDLKCKLEKCLNKPKENRDSRKYISSFYSWDRAVNDTEECYKEIK